MSIKKFLPTLQLNSKVTLDDTSCAVALISITSLLNVTQTQLYSVQRDNKLTFK